MQVTECQYNNIHHVLGFKFDNGGMLFWGAGFLPGTDVPTYRFVNSSGFKGTEYKAAQVVARKYSHNLGFFSVQDHYESFQKESDT